jgi:hypothetical protein
MKVTDRPTLDEIEVTEEMVEAGASLLLDYAWRVEAFGPEGAPARGYVADIYRAMEQARGAANVTAEAGLSSP